MTEKTLTKLKGNLYKMDRDQLINTIWELSSEEFEKIEDVLTIARENDNQLKQRLSHILNWFEYLAK
jgi:BMFP domain-containing protein YqiC